MSNHVVIVGAGFAGLAACKPLAGLARKRKDTTVTLLDSRPYTTMVPALPGLAGGRYAHRYLIEPIGALTGHSVVFRNTRVTTVDLERREVRAEHDRLSYDHLILAAGSVTNLFGFNQHLEAVHTLDFLEDANRIHTDFSAYLRNHDRPTAVVVGGGYTGLELACNLQYAGRAFDSPPRVVVVELNKNILPSMPDWVRGYMVRQAEQRGLELVTGASVSSFDGKDAVLSNGRRLENIFLCWATGTKFAIDDVRGECERIKDGRFRVDNCLRLPGHPEVYAAGGAAAIEHEGRILRKAVNFSMDSGKQAGRNVVSTIEKRPPAPYRPVDLGWIIPFCDTGVGMLFGKHRFRGRLPLALHYAMCGLRNYNGRNRLFFCKKAATSLCARQRP